MSKTNLQSTTHGGGRVVSVILAGTLAFGMTPAVALTTQSLEPMQAFAAQGDWTVTLSGGDIAAGSGNAFTATSAAEGFTVTIGVNEEGASASDQTAVDAGYTASVNDGSGDVTVSNNKTFTALPDKTYTVTIKKDGENDAAATATLAVTAASTSGGDTPGEGDAAKDLNALTLVVASGNQTLTTGGTTQIAVPSTVYTTGQNAVTPTTAAASALDTFVSNLSVTVSGETNPLVKDQDYTATWNDGEIIIAAVDKSGYKGSVSYSYELVYEFGDNNVALSAASLDYNALAQAPSVTVTDPQTGRVMTSGYTPTYQQQVNGFWTTMDGAPTAVGTYKVVVNCANYPNQPAEKTFSIAQRDLATTGLVTTSTIANQPYTGEVIATPDVVVTANYGTETNPRNVVLTKDVDYTVAVYGSNNQPTTLQAVGTGYYLVITGKGNYTGTVSTNKFAVEQVSLADAQVTVTNADKLVITSTTPAEGIEPKLNVTVGGKLVDPSNYDISPSKITAPGLDTALTITTKGSVYSGSTTTTVDVLGSVDLCDFVVNSGNEVTYGSTNAQKAPVQVKYNGKTLVQGRDYSITYGKNTGAGVGAGSYTVTGIGNGWTGSYTGTYDIVGGTPATIEATVAPDITFDGTVQDPKEFIDVELYTENAAGDPVLVDPSKYSYTVTTNNEFKNAGTYTYTITLADCPYNVTGDADAGVEASNTGSIEINKADLSKLTVKPSQDMYLITNNAQGVPQAPVPEYTVTLNGVDYKLTSNDVKPSYVVNGGTATETVSTTATGKTTATLNAVATGNFENSKAVKFDVYFNIANLKPSTIAPVAYNGSAQTPAFKVYPTAADATADTNAVAAVTGIGSAAKTIYTVEYVDNVDAGTGKIILTGTPTLGSTYAGTLEIPFTINKAAATIAVADIADVTYTGSAITPEPKATITANGAAVASTFAYSYANNVNAGTATVTVVPTGVGANYDVAATTKTFKINAANMSAVAYSGDTKVAVNKQPTIKLTYNGKELVAGTDYDVTETPVTSKAGKATLKVTGKGNFTGTKTIEITVEDASTPVNPDKPTTTEGWKQNATGWWYETGEGSYVTSAWKEINGNWYYFNKSGYMMTGWQKINGTWYYLNKKGEGTEGAMVSNAWKKINGTWYHFAKSGAMQTGWQKINGAWYYMAASGAMQTGWIKDGNTWYYLLTAAEGTEGKMVSNQWKQINGSWFYFYASGAMAANTWVGNYWVDANGYWVR